jgi:catechol 2,3-dioxygenase-like lactoylglutathione lyase family enzyme
MIKAIKFVSVPVRDQERALSFYTKLMGFEVLTDQPHDDTRHWIELGLPRGEKLNGWQAGVAAGRATQCVALHPHTGWCDHGPGSGDATASRWVSIPTRCAVWPANRYAPICRAFVRTST